MKLCIPIDVKPEGGMYTFVGNLTSWLSQNGIAFTQNIDEGFDVLFVNSWVVPYATVRRLKRSRPSLRVVHRVDGSAVDYGSSPASDRMQGRVNLLADVTVFQSRYSRYSVREKYPVIAQDGPIIYNPVDLKLFTPVGPRLDLPGGRPRIACASWSTNRLKGTWLIDRLAERHPDMVFVLCGRFDAVRDRDNVVRLGHLSRDAMATALRSCDLFLNLSENDPCPNVVLEALASGLPVLYRDSGGVPELVGDAGLAVDPEKLGDAMQAALGNREHLAALARRRVETHFTPEVIFPQYLHVFDSAVRRPVPSRVSVLKLAADGYPVLPPLRTPGQVVAALKRHGPALVRRLARRGDQDRAAIGWVTYDSYPLRKRRFSQLDSFTGMRVGNVATWMNDNEARLENELYDPDRRYAVVVFQKMMDARCQAEAQKIQAYGGKVVFDANVNYYDICGDYFVPGTKPTRQQQHDAISMTRLADWVIADSTVLAGVIARFNSRVTWVPDNVDMRVYSGERVHAASSTLRLAWSGIGKKAAHLLSIVDALRSVPHLELILSVDEPPECLPELQRALPCRVEPFSNRAYARLLRTCDVIISPKRLLNAYELGHTEYKITLGMAVGLPALASPQQSYVEAIGHAGGGIVASTLDEWRGALEQLRDHEARRQMGAAARQTVIERYSTPVVAAQYASVLTQLAGTVARDVSGVRV